MAYRWHLSFQTEPTRGADLVVLEASVESAFGLPLVPLPSAFQGNPRDGYSRWVRRGAVLEGVTLEAELGSEYGQQEDFVEGVNSHWIRMTLDGDSAWALGAAWSRISDAMQALGYADESLATGSAPIVDAYVAEGALEQAALLRARVTDCLVEAIRAKPPQWGIAAGFSRPDDWARVLGAAADPSRVTSINIAGCDLEQLPPPMLDGPLAFPALANLHLAYNRLTALPPLMERFPALAWLSVASNPMPKPRATDWPGVRIIR
jgi:hypothetical protein